jgi:hypothetical protein
MAYLETIKLVAGDDKPEIDITLKDSNTAATGLILDQDDSATWAPIDISEAGVNVKFRALGNSTTLDTLVCVRVPPFINGNCYMPWNPTTLDVPAGIYEGEIEIVYDTGRVLTLFNKLKFKIREGFND